MNFTLKISLLDAIKRIIECERIHLPIHSNHYWSPSAENFFSKDRYLKSADDELLFQFIKNENEFYSWMPIDTESRFFENQDSEWLFEQMKPMSCYYNKELGIFRWRTGSNYLLSIQQIVWCDGTEINVYIDNEDQFKDPSSVFIPTILKALLV